MANNAHELHDFEAVQERLDQIVKAVTDDELPLDDALDLYEEAVALGMRASELLEDGIAVDEDALAADGVPASDSEDGNRPMGAHRDVPDASAGDGASDGEAASTSADTAE